VLVTGCNTGIGLELARLFLATDASLHFTCRTQEKVAATAGRLRLDFPEARVCGHVLDLADSDQVEALSLDLARRSVPVDTLVLNAGVHVPFAEQLTDEGVEVHRQVNFLAPARLFLHLADSRAPLQRVLYVSSNAHQRGDLPDVFPFSFWSRYAHSKLLANTFFLAARPLFPEIRISVLSPGSVETSVDRHKPALVRRVRKVFGRTRSPAAAATDLVRALVGSDWEAYQNGDRIIPVSPMCGDPDLKVCAWNEVTSEWRGGHVRGLVPGRVDPLGNHAGTLVDLAPSVREPTSEEELASIVREARSTGASVRVVGSKHSYNDCFYSESVPVSLAAFDRIGAIDRFRSTVTVGAGVTVQALCDHLDAKGYALRWAGNSGAQTLVGAALTGTHGYARNGGLLAELIVAARIVTGRGEVEEVHDEAALRALRVSLGTLGLVTEVTLSLVPAGTPVRYSLDTVDQNEFLRMLEEDIPRRHEYFRFFPNRYHSDRFSILTIDRSWDTPPREELERVRYIDNTAAPRPVVAVLRGLMRNTFMHPVVRRLPAPRLRMSFVAPFSSLLFVNAGVVNRWYGLSGLVYQAWNDDRTRNMEVGIRPTDFAAFLRIFESVKQDYAKDVGVFSSYFTGRYTGASDRTVLGANAGRDVIFVDVHVKKCPPAKAFLQTLEQRLHQEIPLRPHWGKEFFLEREDLECSYPPAAWSAFRHAKQHFDPDNVFTNAYTKRVFGW